MTETDDVDGGGEGVSAGSNVAKGCGAAPCCPSSIRGRATGSGEAGGGDADGDEEGVDFGRRSVVTVSTPAPSDASRRAVGRSRVSSVPSSSSSEMRAWFASATTMTAVSSGRDATDDDVADIDPTGTSACGRSSGTMGFTQLQDGEAGAPAGTSAPSCRRNKPRWSVVLSFPVDVAQAGR
jgi:hypothetical protein